MTASSSDEELARRAQQGCQESFEQLMRRFQAPVLHFLRSRGGRADAEDLLQETFLRAYASLFQYRSYLDQDARSVLETPVARLPMDVVSSLLSMPRQRDPRAASPHSASGEGPLSVQAGARDG